MQVKLTDYPEVFVGGAPGFSDFYGWLVWEDAVRTIQRIHGIVPPNPCPYTHVHTRHWCGYDQCRES